ncbi:metabotropic glycine receptor-like isoform X2 [Festucalex cinctus]
MEAIWRLALLLLLHVGLTATMEEEERERLPAAVAHFLRTGEPSALAPANCSRRFDLPVPAAGGRPPERALDALLHAANLLGSLLPVHDDGESGGGEPAAASARRDGDWYRALARSLLQGEPEIRQASVVVFSSSSSDGPGLRLQASRDGGRVVLREMPGLLRRRAERGKRDRRLAALPSGSTADGMRVKWSAPYLDCDDGSFVPRWLLTLSADFYGLGSDMAPEVRGVVRVDVDLQDVDIDQCATDGWFAGTHHCNLTTMECLPMRGHGFVLDKYKCRCRKGFYHPDRLAVAGFTRTSEIGPNADETWSSDCLPCRPGCAFCKDDTPCAVRRDGALRTAVISVQSLCVLAVFGSMLLVYQFRRNKSIRASGLVLLEAILCGALLLYFPVGILYFQPGVFRCILLRWVRLLGFATVYGTLTLKLYRVLKVFLSRTAQRIPYMTSWRVLRLLAVILLVVCWFLVAWTSAACQLADRKSALIDVGYTPDGLQFSMCLLDRWDYMMAVAEFLFLLWSVYLCYAVRTVPSAFHEPRYMAIAVHNEIVLSAIFYVIRFTLAAELHPDWMLLLFFTHTHLTVTVTLGLMLLPKFLFAGAQARDDMASEAYEDELDMGRSGSYLNSSITSAWSEHSLDPDDIREELKKLYSQLEIYKRKKMLANNPHLQKKRSSKKGLGRSLMRRITEIPESVHRQCSREEKDGGGGEHAANRNSICVLKKNPFDQTQHPAKANKEETLKNKVFSLKKSHSSYDHARDTSQDSGGTAEGSLLDALMGKKLAKRKSPDHVNAAGESAESVPLVCKSASAHNLSADKKALRASVLQKSLSVIATAKEKTLGLTGGKSPIAEDGPKKSKEEKQDLYDVSEVCPWEVEDLPSENKVQKHVSIAPEETNTVHGGGSSKAGKDHKQTPSDPSAGRPSQRREQICPWEAGLGQSQSGQGKKQPESRSKAENARRNRAEVCPWDFGDPTAETFPAETPVRNTIADASKTTSSLLADVCPCDDPTSPTSRSSRPKKKGTLVDKDQSKDGNDPKSRTKSKDKSQSWDKQQEFSEVCPWDFGEQTAETFLAKTADAPARTTIAEASKTTSSLLADVRPCDDPASRSSRPKKKGTLVDKDPSKDGDDLKSRTKAKHKSQSCDQRQELSEVCPWDFGEPTAETFPAKTADAPARNTVADASKTTSSLLSDVRPCDDPTSPTSRSSRPKKKGTLVDKDQSKDGNDLTSRTKAKDKSQSWDKQQELSEVCPWDFGETSAETFPSTKTADALARNTIADASKTTSSLLADVRLCDDPTFRNSRPKKKGTLVEKDQSKDGNDTRSQTKAKDKSQSCDKQQKLAEVCPWDVDSRQEVHVVEKRKSANVGAAKVKKADVCPWDFDDKMA